MPCPVAAYWRRSIANIIRWYGERRWRRSFQRPRSLATRCQVALVDAAARAEEILSDRAAETDHDVRADGAPDLRRAARKRRELRELARADDRHAMERHRFRDRHPALADDEVHVVAACRELLRELVAVPLGAAEPIVALVDERDPHDTVIRCSPARGARLETSAVSSALSPRPSPPPRPRRWHSSPRSSATTSGCSLAATLRPLPRIARRDRRAGARRPSAPVPRRTSSAPCDSRGANRPDGRSQAPQASM